MVDALWQRRSGAALTLQTDMLWPISVSRTLCIHVGLIILSSNSLSSILVRSGGCTPSFEELRATIMDATMEVPKSYSDSKVMVITNEDLPLIIDRLF